MGSVLGSCLATALCNCGGKGSKDIRTNFMLILFINIVLATTLRFWGGEFVSFISIDDLIDCQNNACYGKANNTSEVMFFNSLTLF